MFRPCAFLLGLGLTIGWAAGQDKSLVLDQAEQVSLTLSANPAPVPLLRISLFPLTRERQPGNAVLGYFRAMALQPAWPRDPEASRHLAEKLIRWEEMPARQLPLKEVDEYLKQHRLSFQAVDEAARCQQVDWQTGPARAEQTAITYESIQGFRELARFLKLRFRWELTQNRLPDALRTIQTTMQMGQHLTEGTNLIQLLVGIAILQIGLGEVELFLQHPDAPNLYWALASLPKPLFNPRPAIDGEAELSLSLISGLKELEAGPVSEAMANKALQETYHLLTNMLGSERMPGRDWLGRIGLIAHATALAPQLRPELIRSGYPAEQVEAMPSAQVLLLRTVATHRRIWDEQVTWFYLPFPMAWPYFEKIPEQMKALREANPRDGLLHNFSLLYPALMKVYFAQARVNRRVGSLLALEAIRLHASANEGQWPASLADITVVPLPNDLFTGQPFVYRSEGATFELRELPPGKDKPNIGNARDYNVTLRR